MDIRTVQISTLENWKRNPRESVDIERLKEVLTKRGQNMPLLLDGRDMKTILGGNMRLRAMKELGWTECVVSVVMPKDEKDAVEIALEDNDNFGKYVQTQLIELVKEFDIDTSINIDLKPVSIGDIMPQELEAGNIPDDEIPEVKEPISVLGDIYELDGHRVMCGDSTIIDQVQKLMNGKKADMVFTDPPYGVNYHSQTDTMFYGRGNKGKPRKEILNDIDNTLYSQFLPLLKSFSNGVAYIFCGAGNELEVLASIKDSGIELINTLVWDKQRFGGQAIGANYKPCFEMFYYLLIGGGDRKWIGANNEETIWRLKRDNKTEFHPNQKPIELSQRAISNHNVVYVLDLFLGSGSTLIACQKTNRICYGMELDPHYVDVIVNRWCEFTGKYDIIRNGENVNWKELQGKI